MTTQLNQVSLEFAQYYRSATSSLEQLRSNPELLQNPEYKQRMTFCSHGHPEMIPTMMHYAGIALYTSNIDNLFDVVKRRHHPWEVAMSLIALAGWPYEGLLQRSYIDTREKLDAMWKLLLELHQQQQVPQDCWNWLKSRIRKTAGVFPQEIETKIREMGG